MLFRSNSRRAQEEGYQGSAGNSGAVGGGKRLDDDNSSKDVVNMINQAQLVSNDFEDTTDWKTPGFRYRY